MALYKWDTKVAWMWVVDISWKQDKATSGSTAPSTTPSYVGQMYVDTTNGILYTAKWTSSSSDWLEVWAWWGNVIAMTQAEYDALSAAEKADGKLRIITDAPAIDISWWWSVSQADESTIWTVRVATNAEFTAGTDTWSNWEYLVAKPSQIASVSWALSWNRININQKSATITNKWASTELSFDAPCDWWLVVEYTEYVKNWYTVNSVWLANTSSNGDSWQWDYDVIPNWTYSRNNRRFFPVFAWTKRIQLSIWNESAYSDWEYSCWFRLRSFWYLAPWTPTR